MNWNGRGLRGPSSEAERQMVLRAYRRLVETFDGDHEALGVALLGLLVEPKTKRRAGRPKGEGNPLTEYIVPLALEAHALRQKGRYASGKPFTGRFAAWITVGRAISSGSMAGQPEDALKNLVESIRKRIPKRPKS